VAISNAFRVGFYLFVGTAYSR